MAPHSLAARAHRVNLADATLLLTRPEPASARFAAEVEARFGPVGNVVVSPLMEIVPLAAMLDPAPGDLFAVTSEQGARRLADLIVPAGRRAVCVGGRTAAVARALGFDAEEAGVDVEALGAALLAARPSGTVWHVSGRHRRGDLAGRLRAGGLRAETVTVYDQRAVPLSDEARAALARPGVVLAPVFSPRTAALLAAGLGAPAADLRIAAISEAAAAPLEPLPVAVAETPDAAGVLAALGRLIAAQPSG